MHGTLSLATLVQVLTTPRLRRGCAVLSVTLAAGCSIAVTNPPPVGTTTTTSAQVSLADGGQVALADGGTPLPVRAPAARVETQPLLPTAPRPR